MQTQAKLNRELNVAIIILAGLLHQVLCLVPSITVPPMDQTIDSGQPFVLSCEADNIGTIQWFKDGLLLSNGAVMENSVVVNSALPSHAGVYECLASNAMGDDREEATVTVRYAPVYQSVDVQPGEEVVNGSIVTLTCGITGFPPPTITWFHNGVQVMVDNDRVMVTDAGVLVVASVILSDVGYYTCNATNSLGSEEAEDHILLMVYYPPLHIMVEGSPPGLEPRLGERAELSCSAQSVPNSTYSWWRVVGDEGEEMLVANTTTVRAFDGNGSLHFNGVGREDAGMYYCIASNGYGSLSSQLLSLRVSAVPLSPTGVTRTSLSPSSAGIQWNHLTSYPPVHTYHVEYRLDLNGKQWNEVNVASNPNTLTIEGLLPYAPYLVRVSATNPAGRGNSSSIIYFMTESDVPEQFNTVQSSSVSHTNSRTLLIDWTVHPDILATSYASTRIEVIISESDEVVVNKEVAGRPTEVAELEPFTSYTISLSVKFVGGGFGPSVFLQTTTPEDVPSSPPQNITVSSITATTAVVSWLPPLSANGNITSYNISYQPTGGGEEEEKEVGGSDQNVTLTSLLPFTNYTVSVLASTAVGGGPNDSVIFITAEAAPQPPTIEEYSAISSSALRLSWRLNGTIPGNLSGYNVTYSSNPPSLDGYIELSSDNDSVEVDGLQVWTVYEVCVAAATEGGGFGNSSCVSLRTQSTVPDVQVDVISVTPLCPPSLEIVWEPVTTSQINGPEAIFVIRWERENLESNTTVPSNTTRWVIRNLDLNTDYTISVALVNINGSGPASLPVQRKTPSLGAPSVTYVSVVPEQRNILVTWQAPSTQLPYSSYKFSLSISPSVSPPLPSSLSDTSFNITGLTPGTQYIISVSVDGGCGLGEAVANTTHTLESPPGQPVVTIATVSNSSVALQLSEPIQPNGHIIGFMVKCGDEETVNVTLSYYICTELQPMTSLTVSVWAFNSAGTGAVSVINTATSCQSDEVKIESSNGEMVNVQLSKGCPDETHILIVVQEVDNRPRPLESYTVPELVALTNEFTRQKRQIENSVVYITANITRDSRLFTLGDDRVYGGYTNHRLQSETKYRVGVVGVSLSEPATIMTSRNFDTGDGEVNEPEFPLVLVAAIGGGLIFLLLLSLTIIIAITILLCYRHKKRGRLNLETQGKGSTYSFERSTSVRLSGRRGNRPADPVEEYRSNYHTEALEAHSPVAIEGFVNKLLVMKTNDNQLFLEEFGSIEMSPQQPSSVAELPVNRVKNRYHNILPYDHSRVKLSHGKGHGDYINASYCSGFMKVQGFIATQGPLPDTVPDFWRLVWEQNSHTIVMLTNTQEKMKTKCEVYWPREVGCSIVYGSIEVTLTDFTQLADYTIRSLTISKAGSGKEGREVKQFHFTSWPDHGVPQFATAMLAMVRRVMAFHSSDGGPMLVHCSAGVGRTGTFIVIYSMIERMKANRNTIDVYGHVSLLRTQRNYMVQTEDQYFFIYEAVAEAIVCGDTEVSLEQLEEYVSDIMAVPIDQSEHTLIELQFKRLAVDKSDTYRFSSANKDANKAKNRYVNVLPYESSRVVLQYQRAQEGSDYINASFIDGYHYRNAFIATQGPLHNTLADFWRMVWETNVPVIVMLTKCYEKGTERSAQYWPQDIGQSVSCGVYSVQMTVERKSEHYTYRDLLLIDTQTGRKRQVRHFHYLSWPEVGVPSSPIVFLDFLREIQKNFVTLNTKSPITVHCSNGIGRTGVFIALHILLERMVTEGLVDVFQTIKNLRIQRPAMVQTLEQCQFCYSAALDYLETSDLTNQLRSSTRSDSHSLRAVSNASELRSSRRSLNRNDSLRSSAKRSSRNLDVSQVGNGVTTTVYGDSEATSTFSSNSQQHALAIAKRASQEEPSSSTQLTLLDEGAQIPSASPSSSTTPQLLTPRTDQLSQTPTHDHPLLHTNTLPAGGGGGGATSNLQGLTPTSASQTSLGISGAAYPISSFRGRDSGGQRSSTDSFEKQIATLLNINNSNNNNNSCGFVDVYIES